MDFDQQSRRKILSLKSDNYNITRKEMNFETKTQGQTVHALGQLEDKERKRQRFYGKRKIHQIRATSTTKTQT